MRDNRNLFGTDGIRGKANAFPMDSETMLFLGRAAAHVFRRSAGRHRILIGKDTRVSGYMLETALASGIVSMGVDVLLVGPLPTPGIAFMTRSMRADAGVVISASHNSYEDNGIKFFGPDGFKLAESVELEIERLMQPGHLDELRANPELIGKASRIDDALGRYAVYLKSCLARDTKFDGLRIVIDSANGASYRLAPMVYAELGAQVITTGDKPDGMNINRDCGSTCPEHLALLVRQHHADVGVAFDGDADRVIFVDERGHVLDGDVILAALAFDLAGRNSLQGGGVVGTVMSNLGLELSLKERGLKLLRSAVGDRYVLEQMQEHGMNLGGEQSGHVICLDHNTTGDGVLTSLLFLSAARRSGKSLSFYHSLIEKLPQKLVNVKVASKPPLESVPELQKVIRASQELLGETGRILVRYSGTESKIRVMVEAQSEKEVEKVIADVLSVVNDTLVDNSRSS